jgi:2-polyprenyl-6-methoxyphenol hydroxylase-like FAD-dependent oxidoreductase
MDRKRVQIVGGGLAGLALGIGLRLREVPVTLWEAGHYPRHRVCGEVLSGRGCEVLDRLSLLDAVKAAGARPAGTAVFFGAGRNTPLYGLPTPALCLSRYHLDDLLARRFSELGGELRPGQRWGEPQFPAGVVRASGRPVQPTDAGWRWFGLKAHFLGVELEADVEMHLFESGYVGLSRLNDGRVNVCGLFRRSSAQSAGHVSWQQCLRGEPGSLLERRLALADYDPASFCAVAGLPLRPRRAAEGEECRIGDALTMISPITGNGMSMALEAAEVSIPPLAAYSRGELDWTGARIRVAQACDARFAPRLRLAACLHWAIFQPGACAALLALRNQDWVWRGLFRLTR